MIALQKRYRMKLVNAQEDHQPRIVSAIRLRYGSDFADEFVGLRGGQQLPYACRHVPCIKIAAGQPAPVGAWENADAIDVCGIEGDLPPLAVFRQLPPHGVATAEEQDTPELVLGGVGKIWLADDAGKALAIGVIFLVEELSLQELGDHFSFSDAAKLFHAAASTSGSRRACLRRNGTQTRASMMAINTTRTRITSRSVPWNRQMPSTRARLNMSCSQPVLAMRRDIS